MRRILALAAVFSLLTTSCVIGRDSRQSRVESAQGPAGAPVSGAPVQPATQPENDEPESSTQKPNAIWVRGYWHWDGVRSVWQRGHWKSSATGASR